MAENSGNIFSAAPRWAWEAATAPPRDLMAVGRQIMLASRDMLGFNPEHYSERIRREQPLHEASVGSAAIGHGERRGDEQLQAIGKAIVAKATVRAAHDEEVPDHVTEQVVAVAREHGIQPHKNPYVSDLLAHHANRVLEDYS